MKNPDSIPLPLRLKRSFFSLYAQSVRNEHELRYLFWECTLRCNLSCRHCGSDCFKDAAIPDMDSEDFLKALDSIASERNPAEVMICITGGEPLLRDDLEKIGKQITELGFPWGIVTNGLLLTEKRFQSLIQAGMRSLSISLDGPEEQHNWLRGRKDAYKKTVQAIHTAAAYAQKTGGKFAFDVISCAHRNNINHMEQTAGILTGLGVKNWRIFSIFPSGRAKDDDLLSLSPAEYARLMAFIADTRSKNIIHADYSCEGYLGSYELTVRDYFFFCRAGINVASIMCDGNVTGCLSIRNISFFQGNIHTQPFMEIWNNKFSSMRNRKNMKTGICAECSSWKWCRGNGIHLHTSADTEPVFCNLQYLRQAYTQQQES